MKKQLISVTSILMVSVFLLSACSGVTAAISNATNELESAQQALGTSPEDAPNASTSS